MNHFEQNHGDRGRQISIKTEWVLLQIIDRSFYCGNDQ